MSHDNNTVWKEFDDNNISHSATHYLFAVHELHTELGYARMTDISKKLKITAWSWSTGVKALLKKWLLVEDTNKFIKLSEEGESIIEQIEKNREVLIGFFTQTLWLSEKRSTIDACKIEHLLSKETISKLESFLKK